MPLVENKMGESTGSREPIKVSLPRTCFTIISGESSKREREPSLAGANFAEEVDLVARSSSNRLLLFVIKVVPPNRSLPHSAYLSIIGLRNAATHGRPGLREAMPVLVLLTTGIVEKPLHDMFTETGIAIASPGTTSEETRANLREALAQIAGFPSCFPSDRLPVGQSASVLSSRHTLLTIRL
jgi:hypothetical protein